MFGGLHSSLTSGVKKVLTTQCYDCLLRRSPIEFNGSYSQDFSIQQCNIMYVYSEAGLKVLYSFYSQEHVCAVACSPKFTSALQPVPKLLWRLKEQRH